VNFNSVKLSLKDTNDFSKPKKRTLLTGNKSVPNLTTTMTKSMTRSMNLKFKVFVILEIGDDAVI
jgi:hypothetical protein